MRANNVVLSRLADVLERESESKRHMAKRLDQMTATITGAQRKIGGELGPIVERAKAHQEGIAKEHRRLRAARLREEGGGDE